MKRHSSRILPAALVAVLALAACGGDTDDSLPAVTDDGLIPPRPIEITSGGGGGDNAATAELASDPRMSDMAMPFYIAEYVVGEGMPALPPNDIGYVFTAGTVVTAERVAALAAALGVSGEPVRSDDGYFWRVGPDDGTAPALSVYEDAQLSWNYNSAWADQRGAVGCAVAEPAMTEPVQVDPPEGGDIAVPETVVVDPDAVGCEEPTPPEGVPTRDAAEQRARDLIAATGADPAAYQFETYADEWFASVSAVRRVDGLFDANRFDFGFGGEGVMQYANGQLAEPQRVGPYPLIGLDEAVARLNDQNSIWYGGFGGGIAIDMPAVDVAESAVVDAAQPPPAEDVPVATVPFEQMPIDELPQPEPVTVTLVDVEPDVWWAWDADGSVWLLPAYRLIDTDGGWHTVPAVTDEFMIQVEPSIVDGPLPAPEPMPVDPMPVETDPGTDPEPGSASPAVRPVEIIDVVRQVQYYPGCQNEPVTIDGTIWYPLAEFEFGDLVTEIVAIPRQDPADAISGFAPRVAPPGPGDDTGTLVVYADGIARFESDSGDVVWLTLDEQTYSWVC